MMAAKTPPSSFKKVQKWYQGTNKTAKKAPVRKGNGSKTG